VIGICFFNQISTQIGAKGNSEAMKIQNGGLSAIQKAQNKMPWTIPGVLMASSMPSMRFE
jgi:hypothetical protein